MTIEVEGKRIGHHLWYPEKSPDASRKRQKWPICGRSPPSSRDVIEAKKLRPPRSTGEWNQ